MKKLGIIGTGYMARTIAQRAKDLNIETHCFSIDDHSVAAEIADFFHHVNILDVKALLKECQQIGVDGVVATTELTIYPTAYVAYHMGLNGNDLLVSKEITDKTAVRRKVNNIDGLYQPRYWICKDLEVPSDIVYPVVVKPIAAGGKRGISVVYSSNDIEKALLDAMAISKVEGALIEEYLNGGTEYSVESLSYNGIQHVIQVTEKISSGPPHCVELGHHQPAILSKEMRERVEFVVSRCLSAAGVKNGPCHTEIKIIDNKIYLIEINGRPGGDHIAYPLTELSTGFPYITGIIMVALNEFDDSRFQVRQNGYCGVLFVTSQTEYLEPLFEKCESEPWFYKKNFVSRELKPITHNDGYNTNYFMYFSKKNRPDFSKYYN